jgi:hypothetical protein
MRRWVYLLWICLAFHHVYCLGRPNCLQNNSTQTTQKTQPLYCCRDMFTALLHSKVCGTDHIENTILLLQHACILRALPSNGCCLHSHCLATGLYALICCFSGGSNCGTTWHLVCQSIYVLLKHIGKNGDQLCIQMRPTCTVHTQHIMSRMTGWGPDQRLLFQRNVSSSFILVKIHALNHNWTYTEPTILNQNFQHVINHFKETTSLPYLFGWV